MAKKKRKKKRSKRIVWLIIVLFLLLGLAGGAAYTAKVLLQRFEEQTTELVIAGMDVSDLSEQEAVAKLSEQVAWNMTIRYGDNIYSVEDYMQPEIQAVVEQAYGERQVYEDEKNGLPLMEKLKMGLENGETKVISYELGSVDGDQHASEIAGKLKTEWSSQSVDSDMTGYDATAGVFLYSKSEQGAEIDAEKLEADLKSAFDAGDYQTEIVASAKTLSPARTEADFQKIGSYTTYTTANASRNTNVRLACEAVNGLILKAGEQFRFNDVVGQRTAEKGYQEAAAYLEDEVVQEYGGGVCQVSSTLYNAVLVAGLRTDERTGHVFKPSYVTPGQDATVSYPEPEFAFTNTSSASIGIKASYWEQTVYVEVYGVPVLEEGTVRYLQSEKKADLDPPKPNYIEDTSLEYGEEKVVSSGEPGSEWVTYIVTEKNGEVLEKDILHTTKYKGKAAEIRRNKTEKNSKKKKDKKKKADTEEDSEADDNSEADDSQDIDENDGADADSQSEETGDNSE